MSTNETPEQMHEEGAEGCAAVGAGAMPPEAPEAEPDHQRGSRRQRLDVLGGSPEDKLATPRGNGGAHDNAPSTRGKQARVDVGNSAKTSSAYASRHQAAEQRRRCRINERLDQLRQIVPHADRANTASFLESILEYIDDLKSRCAFLEQQLAQSQDEAHHQQLQIQQYQQREREQQHHQQQQQLQQQQQQHHHHHQLQQVQHQHHQHHQNHQHQQIQQIHVPQLQRCEFLTTDLASQQRGALAMSQAAGNHSIATLSEENACISNVPVNLGSSMTNGPGDQMAHRQQHQVYRLSHNAHVQQPSMPQGAMHEHQTIKTVHLLSLADLKALSPSSRNLAVSLPMRPPMGSVMVHGGGELVAQLLQQVQHQGDGVHDVLPRTKQLNFGPAM
mmetsp:Transcript_6000/g.18513  ORF Transcript_6000/g.18513 Transcript_6000/m.18513 type:complete len:389 (-) Transcript_6000:947-2113(-)